MIFKNIDRFLVVGAHCDDIELRCGGTFTRLAREGKQGCYTIAVENAYVGAHYSVRDSHEALAIRREESTKAAKMLGAARLEWLQFKSFFFSTEEPGSRICPSFDNLESLNEELRDAIFEGLPPVANADFTPACRDRMTALLQDFDPQIVFTHYPDDRHPDHSALSRFTESIVQEMNEQGAKIEIWFWEPGYGGPIAGFYPDAFVELTEADVANKQKALGAYSSQFPEGFVEGFAEERARAYGSLAGVPYAEAFCRGACTTDADWRRMTGFIEKMKQHREGSVIHRLDGEAE